MAWVAGVRQAGHSGSLLPQMRTAQSMQKRLWPQGTSAAITSPSEHTTHSRARAGAGAGAAAPDDAVAEGLRLLSEVPESSGEHGEELLGSEVAVEKLLPLEKDDREPCGGRQGKAPTGSGVVRRASGSSRPRLLGSGSVGECRGVPAPLLRGTPGVDGAGAPLTAEQLLKGGRGAVRSKGAQMVAAEGTVKSSARKSKPKSQSSGAGGPVGAPGPSPLKVKPPLPEPLYGLAGPVSGTGGPPRLPE